jgi:hypothetical protein
MRVKKVATRLYGVMFQKILSLLFIIIVAYASLQMAVSNKTEGFSLYREKYAMR